MSTQRIRSPCLFVEVPLDLRVACFIEQSCQTVCCLLAHVKYYSFEDCSLWNEKQTRTLTKSQVFLVIQNDPHRIGELELTYWLNELLAVNLVSSIQVSYLSLYLYTWEVDATRSLIIPVVLSFHIYMYIVYTYRYIHIRYENICIYTHTLSLYFLLLACLYVCFE